MRIHSVELINVAMPLVAPFRTSFGTETERDVLLVHVETDGSEGWGECVAGSAPLYSSEYASGAGDVMERFLLPRLHGALEAEEVPARLAPVKGHRMAKAGLEMALLDAQLRKADMSLAKYLGGVRERVDCGVSVGIHDDIASLVGSVERYLEQGYKRIKLKIEPGWDLEPVAAVRAAVGDDVPLQVDANAAYTLGDGSRLAELDRFGLLLIEQPFAEDRIRDHAALAESIDTPVCLDESITSADTARDAVEMGACSIVNIKPGRVGGLLESVKIHDVCAAMDVPVWCGGMLETGIGRAANVALASLPNFTLPGDTSASSRYFAADITEPFELEQGTLPVPQEAGLGVTPHADRLEATTRSTRVVKL